MIQVTDGRIIADTRLLRAVFERGFLMELTAKADGRRWVSAEAPAGCALQLVYVNQGTVDVVGALAGDIQALRLSDTAAEFRFTGWDADGVLAIREDVESGELLVEPSAYSSRASVQAVRWRLPGAADGVRLVAPFFQGVRLPLGDAVLQRRWAWPMFWEAGLAIFEGAGAEGGFWVHCRDTHYRYKALHIAAGEPGFETEAYGPLDASLGAGGLVWRLGTFAGDWHVPAGAYRDWLWSAYGLSRQEALRRPWQNEVRFAVSWYNGAPDILDALAEKLDPKSVLLHFSQWRTDAYDENYPTYTPSPAAVDTLAKANAMGFHVMPHANSVDMDPSHPAYAFLRDFAYRDAYSQRLHGWGYDPEAGGVLGPPNSNHNLADNRRRKVMIKVHPGLAMWRSILAQEIAAGLAQAPSDAVFIDVTLCSGNLHNCLVENTTSSQGMLRLIEQIQGLGGGLAVGGEGLNEVTMQGLSFAQAHLFMSWHGNAEGLERAGGCDLNDFLFGRLCRTFGYSGLGGRNEAEELRMRIHAEHGAIPTITVAGAEDIRRPNAAVARLLAQAGG
jgi:hypothetical protein